jgi:hypothetical protein
MGIQNSQSSRPPPIVWPPDAVSKEGTIRRQWQKPRFSLRCCNRYLTAPCLRERDGRAIGSGGATNCRGKSATVLVVALSQRIGNRSAPAGDLYNSRISRGRSMATHQSKGQRETVSGIMHEFKQGSSKAVAAVRSEARSRQSRSDCMKPAPRNTRAKRRTGNV